ncbi:MFS transporter [Flexibacterium corallicola]|uniref:MFS transporter n=1 Tax=Flexibacterium corallicola TaxID=3037259 RepID=UPI00286F9ACC|nr:MFS transporter [Pseudovibrio sp. M1P-2-3]
MKLNKPLLFTNFFAGDVVFGLGPYLAIYLLSALQWKPGAIGIVLAIGGITTVLLQTPAGAYIDSTKHKRPLIVICGLIIGIVSISIVEFANHAPVVYVSQVLMGIAIAFIAPSIAAITLGVCTRDEFTVQTSSNQAANHAGNVFSATIAGALALAISAEGVFWLMAVMASLMAISVMFIPEKSIDHLRARGGERKDASGKRQPSGFSTLLSDRRLVALAISVFLFHFANAAMLPLVSQKLSINSDANEAIAFTSACIIISQFMMMLMSLMCAAKADVWGRKIIFLIGFSVNPIRGLLFMSTDNPYFLVSIQSLDGVANGIFGVIILLMCADLTKGSGRFNVTQGAMAALVGIGSACSNFAAEYIVEFFGYNPAFFTLACLAAIAGVFFLIFVPETMNATGIKGASEDNDNAEKT